MITYVYKFNPINVRNIPGIKGAVVYPVEFLVEITIEAIYKDDADAYMASIGFLPV